MTSTADWRTIDARTFTLMLPPVYERKEVRGIDSYVGEFVAPGRRVSFDHGVYTGTKEFEETLRVSGPRAARRYLKAKWRCGALAGDRQVVVIHHSYGDTVFVWGAGWAAQGANALGGLSIGILASDSTYRDEAITILKSVRLKKF
jgi:hypothetical protein